MKIKFKQFSCILQKSTYANNNRTSLVLIDEFDGDCILIVTVNMPNIKLKSDEVIIKNYSENEGILDILIEQQVISKPIRYIQISRFVNAPICKLLEY